MRHDLRSYADIVDPADPELATHFTAEFDPDWYGDGYTHGWYHVPAGEVTLRPGSQVVSAAGYEVGHLDGFVVDANGDVTHLTLRHGHLFGDRDLAIPIGLAKPTCDGRARIALCRDEIGSLPGVVVRRRHLLTS